MTRSVIPGSASDEGSRRFLPPLRPGRDDGPAVNFPFSIFHSAFERRGVVLLLVILILAAMLSISISIFDSVLGEFRISGEITDSFTALYAADQGMEKMLYENRVSSEAWACPGRTGNCEYGPADSVPGDQLPAGACFKVRLERRGQNVTIVSSGEYNCLNRNPDENIGSVKRAFQSSYSVE